MWYKILGRYDNMTFGSLGEASIPAESIYRYLRRKNICEEAGIAFPNWREAKKLLREKGENL